MPSFKFFSSVVSAFKFQKRFGCGLFCVNKTGINREKKTVGWAARFSAPLQTGPGAHPASCTMGTRSFSGVQSGRGVTLTPHPLLVPWSRKSRGIPLLPLWALRPVQSLSASVPVQGCTLHLPNSRAIPLLPLWAVRPVQSLSACTSVHFTFT